MQVQVRVLLPEMQDVARAVEAEFAELDRQVAVEVVGDGLGVRSKE